MIFSMTETETLIFRPEQAMIRSLAAKETISLMAAAVIIYSFIISEMVVIP